MAVEPKRLSPAATRAIHNRRRDELCISAISIWEISFLIQRGRIGIVGSPESFVYEICARVVTKPITPAVVIAAAALPEEIPGDPCDRLIAATSVVESIPLVTADQKLRRAKLLHTIW
jgi:PIN domain nuclease of toxin-antitoxin system